VLSIQHFSNGAYEGIIREVDLAQRAELARQARRRGPRIARPEAERNPRNEERAGYRAKKRVRHSVKQMQADRLLTLTTREQSNTPEVMLERWQRWLKLVERASVGRFHYVAVLEPHPSNPAHLHIHVAIAVFLPVTILRRCWWQVCGGRAMGNVHIKRIGGDNSAARVARVASYISKYITKETLVRFNKKRYWVSRVNLSDAKEYVLQSRKLAECFAEVITRLGFDATSWRRDLWIGKREGVIWFQNHGPEPHEGENDARQA
jgi:hypothetical protein